ncbi:MAG: ABC transporter ATP-binding protein [Firmicutes bacterium]|nr:ABC transporter ATP-binding protein [Bacillota bacterium]
MSKKAIDIKNLNVRYGQNTALSDINLTVEEGDFLGIIGPNGGGKSTLLKAMLGLVNISGGEITVYGKPRNARKAKIGYVPQFAMMDKHFPITVFEVVLTGRLCGKLAPFYGYSKADLKIADDVIERIGISHLSKRRISQLSGGEFQKMLIARALAQQPKVLLLDEPTASVDTSSRRQISALLDEISNTMTIIFVTHDLLAVSSHVKSLACLNTTLVYHGEPQLTEQVVDSLYDCPVDLIAHGVPHRVLGEHKGGR